MLYTSYYGSKKCGEAIDAGRFIVSISRSEPKWLEVDAKFSILAPSYELFHNQDLSNEEWEELYYKQLDKYEAQVIDILCYLETKEAVLCCWCKDYSNCHRSFLTKWAKKHNITIKEL